MDWLDTHSNAMILSFPNSDLTFSPSGFLESGFW